MLALRRAQRLVLILMGLHAARLPRLVVRDYVWRNRKINGCWGAAAEHHVHIHLAALFVFNCICSITLLWHLPIAFCKEFGL